MKPADKDRTFESPDAETVDLIRRYMPHNAKVDLYTTDPCVVSEQDKAIHETEDALRRGGVA